MAVRSVRSPDMIVDEDIYVTDDAWVRRVSWQAILSGVVVALIMQFALNILGLAIGAAAFDPLQDQDVLNLEFSTGTVVWMGASGLIALFVGGIVAGRMAGMVDAVDGALHGFVTWAAYALVSLLLLTSAAGALLGTASSMLTSGLDLAGRGLAEIAPQAADTIELQEIRLQRVQEEARQILGITEADVTQAEETVETAAENVVRDPSALGREVNLAVTRLLRTTELNEADRQDVVRLLVEEGNMSEEEAQQTVDNWAQTYQELNAEAEQTLREVGQQVSDSVAVIAGLVFLAMVLGAFAAAAGGIVGSPQHFMDAVEEAVEDVT